MTGGAKLAGVLGWPVGHSLSPRLHGYWLQKYTIDGTYVPLPVEPSHLAEAVKALPNMGFKGFNLTLPHKEAVMALLDEVEESARAIGAVNTVTVRDGKLIGSNTDGYGFMHNLRTANPDLSSVLVLGAGGAARAVVYALTQAGAKRVVIANRTEARAEALAEHFGVECIPWEKRSPAGFTVIVNTTSSELKGPSALLLDWTHAEPGALATDIVYHPLITPFLSQAQACGLRILDGLGMLLHQAAPGFEAWFDVRPVVDEALREYVLA